MKLLEKNYITILNQIKTEISRSRYLLAQIANKEMLLLYYKIGKIIEKQLSIQSWGSKVIETLSEDLQKQMPGLRGFSPTNLKRMKQFYIEWQIIVESNSYFQNTLSPLPTDELPTKPNEKSPLPTDEWVSKFLTVNFTSHYEILIKEKELEARLFYIYKVANEFWTVETLKYHLSEKLFQNRTQFISNFEETLQTSNNKEKALLAFKDHYLLDFIRTSPEDADNEKLIENEIILNIKKFIMSLGSDFAFIGNQYRLIIDEEEYFIDLLFYNRTLQALVAFELKTGKFKPEYLGKMNFYLSALDEMVKKTHENPSIGIILCKEKKNKTVEFAFRNFNTAMGVATFTTSKKLPMEYENILPDEDTLKKLMDNEEN